MEKDRLTIVMDTSLVMRLKCNKLWMLVPPIIRNIIALSISTYYICTLYMAVQVSTHNMVNILLVYAFNNILWDFFSCHKIYVCVESNICNIFCAYHKGLNQQFLRLFLHSIQAHFANCFENSLFQ